VADCKLATAVVDATVKGAVPVETSDSNVDALNSCAPMSRLPPAVKLVIPSIVPPFISAVVNTAAAAVIVPLALILPEAVILPNNTPLPVTARLDMF
jgi:hypothetical protein